MKDGRAHPFDDPVLVAGYEAWYETAGRMPELAERDLLGRLVADLADTRDAVEIGSGTGHWARWLSGLGWRVVGVDLSEPMVAEAARRGSAWFVRADAHALPFDNNAFDVALAITTLEFLPHPVPALREAARVARRGIVLGVLNRWHPLAWQRKRSRSPLWQAAHFYSPFELTRLLRSALGASIVGIGWRTTLVPGLAPRRHAHLPFGAFIGMRVILSRW